MGRWTRRGAPPHPGPAAVLGQRADAHPRGSEQHRDDRAAGPEHGRRRVDRRSARALRAGAL